MYAGDTISLWIQIFQTFTQGTILQMYFKSAFVFKNQIIINVLKYRWPLKGALMNSFVKSKSLLDCLLSPCRYTDSPKAAAEGRILLSAVLEGYTQHRLRGSLSISEDENTPRGSQQP